MLSKFLRLTSGRISPVLFARNRKPPQMTASRAFPMLPQNQYDMPWPPRLSMRHVLSVYWETIPLFLVVVFGCSLVAFITVWSFQNKVDVVCRTHSRHNISRTMDLRNPTTHKLIIINQKYEAWPEIQDVLDQMKEAERRASLETCEE